MFSFHTYCSITGPPPLEDMTDYVNKLSANTVKYENIKIADSQDLKKDVCN